jgi:hypothetical protein
MHVTWICLEKNIVQKSKSAVLASSDYIAQRSQRSHGYGRKCFGYCRFAIGYEGTYKLLMSREFTVGEKIDQLVTSHAR